MVVQASEITHELPLRPKGPPHYGHPPSHPTPYGPTPKPYGPTPKPYRPTPKAYGPTPKPYGPTPKPYGPTPKPYYTPAPYHPPSPTVDSKQLSLDLNNFLNAILKGDSL